MGTKRSAWAMVLLLMLAAAPLAAQSEAAWVEERTCFSEGLCAFVDPETGLTGYIDKTGKVAVPAQFKAGRPFSEGFAVVTTEDAESEFGAVVHYIDTTGKIVKSLGGYQEGGSFSDGLAQIVTYTGQSALSSYVDAKFEEVMHLPYEYAFGGSFHQGLAWVAVGDIFGPSEGMRHGFMDRSGRLVIPAEYSASSDFDGGIALMSLGGTSGGYTDDGSRVEPKPGDYKIIDAKGAVLREIKGGEGVSVEGPRDGVVIHRSPDGLVRTYGAGGARLFETRDYEQVFPFSDGLALAIKHEPSLEGKDPMPFSYGYLDKTGAIAIPFATPLGLMSRFSDGLYAFFDFDSGLIGFKDKTGTVAIPPVLSPAIADEE